MRNTIDISSNDNALFLTGQCTNRCLMCCQPPVAEPDIDIFWEKNIRLINSAPKELPSIGLTGGEPTLLGDRLIELIRYIRSTLPATRIHILTNGRRFADADFAGRVVDAGEGMLTFGIPLHSDSPVLHDRIAGARNAYSQTLLGLYNLAACDAVIELRVVINKINFPRLSQLAVFVSRNLTFIQSVSLMAMEGVGFASDNRQIIWAEPLDYLPELAQATHYLADLGFLVNIFNVPLCLLSADLQPFACKSISDWKNAFLPECKLCNLRGECCGFFSTSEIIYNGIKPVIV